MSWPVPEEVDDLKKKGNALYRQGQYSEAVEEYTSALRMLNPDVRPHSSVYSSVLANRAAAWLKLGNCEECIKDSSESIRLRPDFVRAYVRRAEAYEVSEK
jgi:import receptor subunit TOM34